MLSIEYTQKWVSLSRIELDPMILTYLVALTFLWKLLSMLRILKQNDFASVRLRPYFSNALTANKS